MDVNLDTPTPYKVIVEKEFYKGNLAKKIVQEVNANGKDPFFYYYYIWITIYILLL